MGGNHDKVYSLTTPSAPALAMNGKFWWNSTSRMPSSAFFLWDIISCVQVWGCDKSQKRTEQSCEPDASQIIAGSIDSEVTPSRWAAMSCLHSPTRTVNGARTSQRRSRNTCIDVEHSDVSVLECNKEFWLRRMRRNSSRSCGRRVFCAIK